MVVQAQKLARMEEAVRVLIRGLGEDLDREGLRDTPKRVAKALLDCTRGYHQDTSSTLGTALFHEPIVHQGDEGVVVVRDIDFASTSEETLLPFHGRCHVAYRPKDGVVLGLSKLARLTKQYAKRLQTQERLAAEVLVALQGSLECHGVAVVLQARHLSNSAAPEERTTACVSGVYAAKGSSYLEELLALLDLEDLPASAVHNLDVSTPGSDLAAALRPGCPRGGASDGGVPAPGTPDPSEKDTDGDSDDLVLEAPCCCDEMESAMQQLIAELGENPHRPGLAGSARRYVMSLLASTSGYNQHSQVLGGGQAQDSSACPSSAQTQTQGQGQAQQELGPGRSSLAAGGCARGCCCGAGASAQGSGAGGLTPRSPQALGGRRGRSGASGPTQLQEGPLQGAVVTCLPFSSQCEHHMLPFYGNLMVAYFPSEDSVRPSGSGAAPSGSDGSAAGMLPAAAVEAAVTMYTQRLQVQERITHQVADEVEAMLRALSSDAVSSSSQGVTERGAQGAGDAAAEAQPGAARGGVMVVCDAAHMCMVARGVENHSGSTTSFAVRGAFAGRPELRRAVLRLFREQ
ncbi:hypothetical protein HYH03_003495 [Edaphochlamys debaryana]|uniref:GTP cyclohydrolase 1 n=1 Tax=Edaphochlamys debaryana TaxID=47281 RepID=A0A835YDB6_9CHLO|nr:hypothetical protein HYH03_003495 [Edaphochlamys debaryana]|eukprot:KAG2498756.1 hypothetical protein HYH03_003495 [Edaphochlamys debaryana]